jgi:exodeoxyribonuclease VIII
MSLKNVTIRGREVNSEEYHEGNGAKRGDSDFEMSASMLREFGVCASRWLAGYTPPDSEAKDYGSLLDCLYLTPGQFAAKYAVRPDTYKSKDGDKPWNNNATVCREWNEATEAEGRKPLKKTELAEAQAAIRRLESDKILSAFHDVSEKQVWLTGLWTDDATGLTVPVKALVDLAPAKDSEFAACLGDLKSTRAALPSVWSRYSSQRKYHLQGALYLDMWNAATGEARDTWCFILSENFPPYQTGRAMLSQQKLEYGRVLYQAYLARYCQCLKTGVWPDYQTGPGVIQGWSLDDASRWDEMESIAAMEGAAPDEAPPVEETDSETPS